MSRFRVTPSADLFTFLAGAVRRRANPFAVVEATIELLNRNESPSALGEALLTLNASLAGEVREALDSHRSATARFLQSMVGSEGTELELEEAWRSACYSLSKLRQFAAAPRALAVESIRSLAQEPDVLKAAQVALATADPQAADVNRWFIPIVLVDGSEASIDALLPHVNAALAGERAVVDIFVPLLGIIPERASMDVFIERVRPSLSRAASARVKRKARRRE